MRKIVTSTSLISATLLTVIAVMAPVTASAREGSVGGGLKCYTAAVVQADGSIKYQKVCYKGV